MYYTYIVRCGDGYLYVGISGDIHKRLKEHESGLSRLTKSRGKIELVYVENFETRAEAAKREREIKGWRREKKEGLIKKFTLKNFEKNFEMRV